MSETPKETAPADLELLREMTGYIPVGGEKRDIREYSSHGEMRNLITGGSTEPTGPTPHQMQLENYYHPQD
ncbi:hypothetical protein HYZ99_02250 [Candidatus Peregrinibacteria bacterium]|nr:hypothetical protein [Candidatus Peregrinibacteria bacterium]